MSYAPVGATVAISIDVTIWAQVIKDLITTFAQCSGRFSDDDEKRPQKEPRQRDQREGPRPSFVAARHDAAREVGHTLYVTVQHFEFNINVS